MSTSGANFSKILRSIWLSEIKRWKDEKARMAQTFPVSEDGDEEDSFMEHAGNEGILQCFSTFIFLLTLVKDSVIADHIQHLEDQEMDALLSFLEEKNNGLN